MLIFHHHPHSSTHRHRSLPLRDATQLGTYTPTHTCLYIEQQQCAAANRPYLVNLLTSHVSMEVQRMSQCCICDVLSGNTNHWRIVFPVFGLVLLKGISSVLYVSCQLR